jgi:hypothetical protein
VWGTWAENPYYATNAPFTFLLGGSTEIGGELVNLRRRADDLIANGHHWERIGGTVTITSTTTFVVRTTNDANGFVQADAIRIDRRGI